MSEPRGAHKIVWRETASLVPYARNARTHSEAQIKGIAASIQRFGFNAPVLTDAANGIIAGHGRVLAAEHLGMAKVPCVELPHLSAEEKRAYILADNRWAENAGTNLELLSAELKDLEALSMNLDVLGFGKIELESLLARNGSSDDPAQVWQGLPQFTQDDLMADSTLKVHFADPSARNAFAALVGQPLTDMTKYIWYPAHPKDHVSHLAYKGPEAPVIPRYPIYIISKGRWESRLTAKALQKIGIDFRIVIEPQEYDQYAAVIPPEQILTLPFSNLGQGSIPARNWVWEHAIEHGAVAPGAAPRRSEDHEEVGPLAAPGRLPTVQG